MPKLSIQVQKIMDKLTPEERKQLKKYEKAYQITEDKMIKAQSAYTIYTRKTKDSKSLKARKLADKGFEYTGKAFKAANELNKYRQKLINKYVPKK